MEIMNGIAGNHQTNFKGYILRPLSMPGQYDKKAARAVSNTKPKFNAQFLMPW